MTFSERDRSDDAIERLASLSSARVFTNDELIKASDAQLRIWHDTATPEDYDTLGKFFDGCSVGWRERTRLWHKVEAVFNEKGETP